METMTEPVFNPQKFAAFIITRDRPKYLENTIQELKSQTISPSLILIVDNSETDLTSKQYKGSSDESVAYLHTGYNAGPAGGAYYGFKTLFEKGYDWVMWVDDDDPPKFNDMTEELVKIIENNASVRLGMVGAVGERFDLKSAKIIRFRDQELKRYLQVDTISGNMFPLVNRKVFEEGILPDKHLFFGYEELDFGLSLKRGGWQIMVSGDLHYRHRELAGRLGLKEVMYQRKKSNSFWREYYSTRNLMNIILYKEKRYATAFRFFFKTVLKSIFVFGYGFSYGLMNSWYLWLGLIHGVFHIKGQFIQPIAKRVI
jgi:GT2 family glycosyltransferase